MFTFGVFTKAHFRTILITVHGHRTKIRTRKVRKLGQGQKLKKKPSLKQIQNPMFLLRLTNNKVLLCRYQTKIVYVLKGEGK